MSGLTVGGARCYIDPVRFGSSAALTAVGTVLPTTERIDDMLTRTLRLGLVVTVLGSTGCATVIDSAVDAAARRTGQSIGDAAGQRIGAAAASRIPTGGLGAFTPELMTLYVGYLFSLGFHSGSYTFEERAYEPGEWTRWVVVDDDTSEMERAFLTRTADGGEWWRVKYTDREEGEAIVLEGLFSAERRELIRLRAQMPGEDEPSELPVQEGTYGYAAPVQLTAESVEGATVGTETVRVPAGSFQARHIRYGSGTGTIEWWLTGQVPGGMVRYTTRQADGESVTVELSAHGRGAVSELGAF